MNLTPARLGEDVAGKAVALVDFEGIDGAGKSSLISAVAGILEQVFSLPKQVIGEAANTIEVVTHSLPDMEVPLGRDIRWLVKQQELTVMEEIAALTFNRSLCARRLREMYGAGEGEQIKHLVLMDRWLPTCIAYQGADLGNDLSRRSLIVDMHEKLVGLDPMLVVYVDTGPADARERMLAARPNLDNNEQSLERQKQIHENYEVQYRHSIAAHGRSWLRVCSHWPIERAAMYVANEILEVLSYQFGTEQTTVEFQKQGDNHE